MDPSEVEFLESVGLHVIDSIAKGGYGIIYLVHSNKYQTDFALKKIPKNMFNEAQIECMKNLYDPNIVSLYQYYVFNNFVYLLLEFCPSDLNKLMAEKPEFSDEELYRYSLDVLHAVKACHDRHIAHSDIKPANFLIDKYGRLKIGDFGLSTLSDDHMISHVFKGTRTYMAPEIFSQDKYNPIIADVWSIGVTLYFMATRMMPFYSNDQLSLQRMIEAGIYPEDEIHNLLLRKVISKCLEVNTHKRATIQELLDMPYFKQGRGENISLNNNAMKASNYNIIVKPKVRDSNKIFLTKSHISFYGRNSSRLSLLQSQSIENFNEPKL